jgi:type VI secretion system VasD/TssJ family lipoprotein
MGEKALFTAGALLLLLCTGCTVTSVDLQFQAIEPVNLDQNGTSQGVQVLLYQLKDRTKFEAAETEAVWDKPQETLGGDLVQIHDPKDVIAPEKGDGQVFGRKFTINPLNSETKFIGILALINEKDDQGKRHIAVTVEEADDVVFRITGYHVEIKR